MVLEALAEYELKGPVRSEVNLVAEFTVQGRKDIIQLVLDNKKEKVETDLKVPTSIINIAPNTHKY